MDWLKHPIPKPDQNYQQAAIKRQQQLTKPSRSLGDLEQLSIKLATLQATNTPSVDNIWISIFAADHGIAETGVSAFPQTVTAEMVKNFVHGGAAINVLAKQHQAHLEIIDVGVASSLIDLDIIHQKVAFGTANFLTQPAMPEKQLALALQAGKDAVSRALVKHSQLFIAGEMGIANTSSAAAIACHLLEMNARQLTGAGTGLDSSGIRHKASIIQQALDKHKKTITTPFAALQYLGGFEIAALTAAYLTAAQHQLPVLVDGFICSVAALLATRINADIKPWLIYAHQSQEQGHSVILKALDAKPLLSLNMRLGEASGAAVAIPLLRSACALHNQMATFAQAQVSES
ncbi:nicotinate-nucleotide--dimethylbenzimidazole phosphoribosyltransferase [Bathymodiolus japonicus methanotrophic gill symbiont]|uniref:nicotinate-nucleotide--dimethylbenzimidazole phosphoribosyltransferase n=1 Tax=Bathymodiolus japonicus methanotrophic gill symbiont TaxID=113269 RepID=UPI001B6BF9BE|nr:nicotinate-nucleotide--dimethylbenzimidazole phosphoribosyltransferase [Bathymodiolus japonicus methanotrophic gill symbiont]GFO71946.1 nicotinate-nucleotide--dimethylbenzimidazole phosphoribosyltransferase [Bathymodiolus japonicus methanotrophic gill symbiont]